MKKNAIKCEKLLGGIKYCRIFAPELNMERSIQVLIAAIFFISVCKTGSTSYCCYSSGSRCKALLTFPKIQREQQFFILNIFNPTMERSVKNETKYDESSVCFTSSHETAETRPFGSNAENVPAPAAVNHPSCKILTLSESQFDILRAVLYVVHDTVKTGSTEDGVTYCNYENYLLSLTDDEAKVLKSIITDLKELA